MKTFKKLIKKEKGSITITVVASMLFITTMITIAYFTISNQSNDQSKKISQVVNSYKVTNSEITQKYREVQDNFSDSSLITITAGQKAPANSNAQYKSGNYTAIIPAGFTVSNEPGEISIETGLVIRDDDGNEFVWIPVNIPWKNDSSKTITLSRYTFDGDGIPTNQGVNAIEDQYGDTYTELASSSYGNAVAKNINDFISKTNAAGGFWIGRYEARTTVTTARTSSSDSLTAVTEKPGKSIYNYIKQTDASTKSREMYSENKYFESDLMNSYAWDTATIFLQEYDNREGTIFTPYSKQNSINTDELLTYGTVLETNKDKICNVYDMASNCVEWTTETCSYSGYPCVFRGGYSDYGDSDLYTSSRIFSITSYASRHISFRPILYIK